MVCNTHSNLCITFVIAGNFDEIITRIGLILFILQLKLKRTERCKQFVMSESTKKRKRESRIIHGRPQKFFRGGNVDILFIIYKLLTISVPSKIILH